MARIIKKYGNRRLYDTEQSGYVTLAELEQIVREGADIRVVDAKSGADLTQSTLVQIILDSRRAAELLPVPLLVRLVRLGDDALAEFFGQYVGAALQMYLQAKQGFQMVNPLAAMANPMDAFGALGRVWNGWGEAPAPTPEPSHAAAQQNDDISSLRREIDELKAQMQGEPTSAPKAPKKRSAPRKKAKRS